MIPVPDVNGLSVAFGNVAHLPPMKDIPEEFKGHRGNKWTELFSQWFYSGLPKGTEFVPKPGVDKSKALAAIRAVMVSFEPKHEHKEAGVAYLLSEWFDDIKVPDVAPKDTSDG